jgi:two-component system sensor histidine kinase/response regulator
MIDDTRPAFDLAALDRYTVGDRGFRLELLRLFLEDCPSRLRAVHAAVHDGDAERLRSTAHALRGSAAFLTAAPLIDEAVRLEAMGRDGRLDDAAAGLDRLDAAAARLLFELRQIEE